MACLRRVGYLHRCVGCGFVHHWFLGRWCCDRCPFYRPKERPDDRRA